MLVTCKHGKDWELKQDERCATDNAMYDRLVSFAAAGQQENATQQQPLKHFGMFTF